MHTLILGLTISGSVMLMELFSFMRLKNSLSTSGIRYDWLRSPVAKEVHDWTMARGVTIITAQDVHEFSPAGIAERAADIIGDGPSYLSLDIDVLDPAFAPGTGTPEIGGLATWRMQTILRRLARANFVGMDMVEVAPPYDVVEITALAAATMVWEYLALVGRRALT